MPQKLTSYIRPKVTDTIRNVGSIQELCMLLDFIQTHPAFRDAADKTRHKWQGEADAKVMEFLTNARDCRTLNFIINCTWTDHAYMTYPEVKAYWRAYAATRYPFLPYEAPVLIGPDFKLYADGYTELSAVRIESTPHGQTNVPGGELLPQAPAGLDS